MKNFIGFFLCVLLNVIGTLTYAQKQEVIDSLQGALNIATEDTTKIIILNSLAWEFSGKDPGKSIINARQALEIGLKLKLSEDSLKQRLIADSYHQIAWANYMQGNYDTSLTFNLKALELRNSINYRKGIASSLNNIGNIYRSQSDLVKALEYYKKSVSVYDEIKLKNKSAVVLGNIGLVYYDLGNHAKALENYFKTVKLLEESGDFVGVARNLGNIGIVFKDKGDYHSALEYYFKSLKINEEQKYKSGISKDYGNIGVVYRRQKKYSEALDCYRKALQIDEEINNKPGIARQYSNIGVVYGELNQNENALEYFLKALKMDQEMENSNEIAIKNINIGSLYCRMKDYEKAREYIGVGLKIAKEIKSIEVIKDAYLFLVSVDSAQGNFKQAFEHYSLFTLFKDSLVSEHNSKEVAELKIAYEAEKKDVEIALLKNAQELNVSKLYTGNLIWKFTIGILVLLIVSAFLLFSRIRLIHENRRIAEKDRISSDLHDDIGSSLSKIVLLSELIKRNPKDSDKNIEKIVTSARETLSQLSSIIWTLNPKKEMLENFIAYSRKYAMEYFELTGIECEINAPDNIPKIEMSNEQRRNLFLSLKEILHNIVKHSNATNVKIFFMVNAHSISIKVSDNGIGLVSRNGYSGNGLNNITRRMNSIGGKILIENGQGVTVDINVSFA